MVSRITNDHVTSIVMATLGSYQDNNQHEEAVRDLERVCQMDRSRGT